MKPMKVLYLQMPRDQFLTASNSYEKLHDSDRIIV